MSDLLLLHGLGAVVEVRCEGAAGPVLASALRSAWSRCRTPAGTSAQPRPATPVVARLDHPDFLIRELMLTTRSVTRALITARAGDLLMFHAGAVSDPGTGRSLVYVAAGGTGKTTMSRLLGQRLGYLTDETVGIDPAGGILPYPKPLSVRRVGEPDLKDEVSPDALGLLAAPANPTVARVVLLDRRAEVDQDDLSEVGFMDAVVALVAQSSSVGEVPHPLQRLADLIDTTGPVLRLRYSEAASAEKALVALLEDAS
ncbi:hypothetical protein ACOCJ4_07440 [Knoellia sp. CPCC 206435]|uniref:hypothetical protein n=1 Tax=Knoellia terrae TaxID=3404797 RepID=UPI003B43291F